MSEHKGVPGEARRFQLNLTSADLRSGVLHLPASMVDLFDSGPISAQDADTGDSHMLNFEAPRQIGGLSPFFARHELAPNDIVTFIVGSAGVQLSATRRPRQPRPESKRGESAPQPPAPAETGLDAEPPAALSEAPLEQDDEGFQYIRVIRRTTHIERPRASQLVGARRSQTAAATEPEAAAEEPSTTYADDDVEVLPWKRRRTNRRQRADQSAEQRSANSAQADEPASRPAAKTAPPEQPGRRTSGSGASQIRPPEGPPSKSGRPEALVARFLARPDTPTIIRTDQVAERLGLSITAARSALDALAGVPDSGVRRVKPDSYLVSQRVVDSSP